MRKIVLLVLFASAILLYSCNPQYLLSEEAPPPAPSNFHTSCSDCHMSEQPNGPETIGICYKCHFNYFSNHHPVDFTPPPDIVDDNAGYRTFPLVDGQLRCQSCHEIHQAEYSAYSPNLLKGGPWADRRDACFICHFREQYEEIYPHEMLDAGANVIELNGKPICLFCHREKPDPLVDRTKDVTFKADVAFLCWRCHPPMPDTLFFGAHFLVTPRRETLRYMKKYERENNVIFPIVPHDRITCSTCHNPHQRGVIKHEAAAKGADEDRRLRLNRPEICRACHKF